MLLKPKPLPEPRKEHYMDVERKYPKSGKGFVTIATGDSHYYRLAVNLLRSYRQNSCDPSPFALICDRDCIEAREFDEFVLIKEAHCSYLDKLSLYRYAPYEEVIFIDADSLILNDTRVLWQDFTDKPAFSCYGAALPLDSRAGWFFYEDMGELKSQLTFGVSMHGGLYYLRKTEQCSQIFAKALELVNHYHQYTFAFFKDPADEPVLALSMALNGCKPCPVKGRIIFLPSHEGQLRISRTGKLMLGKYPCDTIILHFGNRNLPRFLYQYLLASVDYHRKGGIGSLPMKNHIQLKLKYLHQDTKVFLKQVAKKILPSKILAFFRKLLRN